MTSCWLRRTQSFKTVEASLRVDAPASARFKISRSKLVNLTSNGDVRVNWTTVTKNETTLKTGEIVSLLNDEGNARDLNFLEGVLSPSDVNRAINIPINLSKPADCRQFVLGREVANAAWSKPNEGYVKCITLMLPYLQSLSLPAWRLSCKMIMVLKNFFWSSPILATTLVG
ncbi:hypothetical protein Godav_001349 [Gossypium davidsonii]|uniref:RNA-binding S4 domain-containing protein n=1 Tax=Gossypium davidsonii TaxID=34287 RepID=A0A7J8T375_GOSDV|nr:hypothetical protein [Gossypium davidsonii]